MKTITRYRRDRDRSAAIFQEHKDRITSYMNETPLSKPYVTSKTSDCIVLFTWIPTPFLKCSTSMLLVHEGLTV